MFENLPKRPFAELHGQNGTKRKEVALFIRIHVWNSYLWSEADSSCFCDIMDVNLEIKRKSNVKFINSLFRLISWSDICAQVFFLSLKTLVSSKRKLFTCVEFWRSGEREKVSIRSDQCTAWRPLAFQFCPEHHHVVSHAFPSIL